MLLVFILLLSLHAVAQCAEASLTPRSKRTLGLHLLRQNRHKKFQALYGVQEREFRYLQRRLPQKDRYSFTAIAAGASAFGATHDVYRQETLRAGIYGVLIMGAVLADAAYECGRERKLKIIMDDFLKKHEEGAYSRRGAGFMSPEEFEQATFSESADPEKFEASAPRETFRSIRAKEAAELARQDEAADCDWDEMSHEEILDAKNQEQKQ